MISRICKSTRNTFISKGFPFFYFSSNSKIIHLENNSNNDTKIEIIQKIPNFKQQKTSSGSFTLQLVPIPDHPLVPNYPAHLILNRDEFDNFNNYFLNSKSKQLAASVVKNPKVFEAEESLALMQGWLHIPKIPNVKSIKDVYDVGVICESAIKESRTETKNSIYNLLLIPTSRMKISQVLHQPNPIGLVKCEEIIDLKTSESDLSSEQQVIFKFLKTQYLRCFDMATDAKFKALMRMLEQGFDLQDVNDFIHFVLSLLSLPQYLNTYKFLIKTTTEQIQDVFQETDLNLRLNKLSGLFSDFVKKIELWAGLETDYNIRKDNKKAAEKIEEIYNTLKSMFSKETDEKVEQIKKFKEIIERKKIPASVLKIITEDLERFGQLEKGHQEYSLIRTYIDIITSLPWGITSEDTLDIMKAQDILDATHYGMKDVKERILEFLAVAKLKGSVQGKIICLLGPPGVGKTSIGESIANAINRKFYRISVGGDRETSSLKGFRRTYVGSGPGKLIQALRRTEVENPVILIDEIDKIGTRSFHGDPSSVLLEILDPQQNHSFIDDYLDVPVDLSKVLFVCTANSLDSIPLPLLDRFEIIQLSGYTSEEKLNIYSNYLYPDGLKKSGLNNKTNDFHISHEAVKELIHNYSREPGVRSLQRNVNRILEKIALKLVKESSKVIVNAKDLEDYIGPAPFHSSKIYPKTQKGVICGLAYNNYGGSILFIECVSSSIKTKRESICGSVKVTGHLGDVMKESTSIAYTYAKNLISIHFNNHPASKFFAENDIHIHFPEGATPKDGPSAGIAITSSLLSNAFGIEPIQNLAMTGEITLNGKILAIGGLKEKLMAAKREGINTIIIPKANEPDFHRLPKFIQEGFSIYFLDDYIDAFQIIFPSLKLKN